jgi:hypothetical protein
MTNEKDIYQELSDKITEVIQLIPDTDEKCRCKYGYDETGFLRQEI